MLMFQFYSRTAWNDYFTGTKQPNFNSQTITSRQTPTDTSVYILNCLFGPISTTSAGGALYCSTVTNLLIESTSFFSCKTSSNGGAVYFSNSGGQCVLHEVCGYDCCTTNSNSHQFAYIYVNNDISSKNYINYSSIVRCVNEVSGTHYMLYLGCGKICCPSVNMSMNKCYYRIFYCNPLGDSNSFTCSFSYSSFTDNTATGHTCFFLWNGANFEIKSCNILRNAHTVYPNSEGIIYTCGNVMIDDSCILENKAYYTFRQGSSYTITISNCTVDSTSNNGYLTTRNTITKSFIHALNHMSNLICHAEYDAAGILTPITPLPPSSKKQRQCYTGDKFFPQPRLRDVISLTSIFIFNFINPNASFDLLY
jgi:hypothetical protein